MTTKIASGSSRKIDRIFCHIRGSLRWNNQSSGMRVTDISKSGMALELRDWVGAAPGSKVTIQTSEFGTIEATVRWYRAGRMGVQIDQTSNTAAQIATYLKNYHTRAMAGV